MPAIASSDEQSDRPLPVVEIVGAADASAGEHGAEEEQHDDGADVDQHLRDRDELGSEQHVLGRGTAEHDHEPERGVHDVVRRHDADRSEGHGGRDHAEGDVLRDHRYFFFTSAPASRAGASGTVSIHSLSRSLSWSRSAMRGSEYSYSGLQNNASNGHTSTQMPQYMHSA